MDTCYDNINQKIQLCLQLEKEHTEQKLTEDMNGLVIVPKPKKKSQKQIFYLSKK